MREGLGLNQTEFGKLIDSTQIQVSRYEKETVAIPEEVIQKMHIQLGVDLNIFMNPDSDWSAYLNEYLSAYPSRKKGQMIGFQTGNMPVVVTQPEYRPVLVTVDDRGGENIVAVDVKAAAGYVRNHTEPKFFSKLPAFKFPGARFRNGTFRAFEIEGDSMEETLRPGDWVITRFIDDFGSIKEGYIHVILLKDSIVVKRVLNRVSERGKLVLISDNEDYRPYEVEAGDVREIWRLVCKITFDFTNKRSDLQVQINHLKDDVASIRDTMRQLRNGN